MLSSNGTLLTNPDEISERWREHFHSLLNCDTAGEHEVVDGLEVLPLRQEIDVPPTEEEVAATLDSLRERKAPGGDAIPAEILKFGGDAVKRALAAFYMQCWETKTLPQDLETLKLSPYTREKVTGRTAETIGVSPCYHQQGRF